MAKIETALVCYPQVPFVRGGTELLVASLCDEFAKRGVHTEPVAVPFQWHPKQEIIRNCMAWRLLDLTSFEGRPVDLVVTTKFPSYLVKHPNKVTYLFHQFRQVYDTYGTPYSNFVDDPEDNRIREMIVQMDNRFLPEARRTFTISKNVSSRLKQYNGIDSETLYPPPRNRERFHGGEYGDYLLHVGRLNKTKRIDLLIRAMEHVDDKVKCLIVGSGEELTALQKLIHKLDLDANVQLLGFVDEEDLLDLYAGCFGVFYAPHDEDFGFSTVEAFLARKPVITTVDAGGPLEFVEDGVTGCVADTSPAAIAGKIEDLFFNRDFCRALGEQGHERAADISWEHVIDNLIAAGTR